MPVPFFRKPPLAFAGVILLQSVAGCPDPQVAGDSDAGTNLIVTPDSDIPPADAGAPVVADGGGPVVQDAGKSADAGENNPDGGFMTAGDAGQVDGNDGGTIACGDLRVSVRDFQSSHPDFQSYFGTSVFPGLVLETLGEDQTPVFNPNAEPPAGYGGSVPQITSAETFADWYHDVDGVNVAEEVTLSLVETEPQRFVYDNQRFFPIDGRGFANETFADSDGAPRNFHFTTEIHTRFRYAPGQTFTFIGDDDLWLFVDGRLAIDLGGLHPPQSATVDLDTLNLIPGELYPMDIFHAERRIQGSSFRIETSIDCFVPPGGLIVVE